MGLLIIPIHSNKQLFLKSLSCTRKLTNVCYMQHYLQLDIVHKGMTNIQRYYHRSLDLFRMRDVSELKSQIPFLFAAGLIMLYIPNH